MFVQRNRILFLYLLCPLLLLSFGCSKYAFTNFKLDPYRKSMGALTLLMRSKLDVYQHGNIDPYLMLLNNTETERLVEEEFFYDFLRPNFEDLIPEISNVNISLKKNERALKIRLKDFNQTSSLDTLFVDSVEGVPLENFDHSTILLSFHFKLQGKFKGAESYTLLQKLNYKYTFFVENETYTITKVERL